MKLLEMSKKVQSARQRGKEYEFRDGAMFQFRPLTFDEKVEISPLLSVFNKTQQELQRKLKVFIKDNYELSTVEFTDLSLEKIKGQLESAELEQEEIDAILQYLNEITEQMLIPKLTAMSSTIQKVLDNETVIGWRGLTIGMVDKLSGLDLQCNAEEMNEQIDYDIDEAELKKFSISQREAIETRNAMIKKMAAGDHEFALFIAQKSFEATSELEVQKKT